MKPLHTGRVPTQKSFAFGQEFWRPEKPRRPGPMDLLALIRTMVAKYPRVGCKAGIAWFAEHFSVCARTIQRWLRKIQPWVEQIVRGWHRAAAYKIIPGKPLPKVSPQTVTPVAPGHYCPNSGFRILKIIQRVREYVPFGVPGFANKPPRSGKRRPKRPGVAEILSDFWAKNGLPAS